MTIADNSPDVATDFGRTPPHDLAAEQGALGGMLLSKDAIADVGVWIKPADHYRPAHQIIHQAILDLYAEGEPADAITVGALLLKRGLIAKVGGRDYLHTLLAAAPTAAFAGAYAKEVHECAAKRLVIEQCTRAIQLTYEGDGDATEIAARALAEIEGAVNPVGADTLPAFGEVLQETITSLESKARRGLELPWQDLDHMLLGLAPGQLVIIGARPGIGKSVALADIAVHTAKAGKPVLLMSAEMTRQEIATRIISADSRVNLQTLLGRTLVTPDWEKVSGTFHKLEGIPLALDDEPGPSAAHIQGRLRQMDRTGPAALLAVDYLQLMSAPAAESRQVAVADLGWHLKQIARKRGIPVVVACQLNRNPEARADHKPRKEDLRESGALEQHADVVILLHREDAYDPESVRAGEIDLIVDKNRMGPQGIVTAAFQGHFSTIRDMARA